MRRTAALLAASLCVAAPLGAQDLGLITGLFEDVNAVTVFLQTGAVAGSEAVRTDGVLRGAGTDVLINLRSSGGGPSYELGLGASFIRGFEAREAGLDLRGTLRAFPTIALYASNPRSWGRSGLQGYAGVMFGLIELWNGQAYDAEGRSWSIDASTFEIGGAGGVYVAGGPLSGLFVETSYRYRDFNSVRWTGPDEGALPEEWPRSLDLSGPVVSVGWQFSLRRRDEPEATAPLAGVWTAQRAGGEALPSLLEAREEASGSSLRRELTGAYLLLSPGGEEADGGRYELTLLVRETVRDPSGRTLTHSPAPDGESGRYSVENGRIRLVPGEGGEPHVLYRLDGSLLLRLGGTGHAITLSRAGS